MIRLIEEMWLRIRLCRWEVEKRMYIFALDGLWIMDCGLQIPGVLIMHFGEYNTRRDITVSRRIR